MPAFTDTVPFNASTGAYVQLCTLVDGACDISVRFSQDVWIVSGPQVNSATDAANNEAGFGYFAGQTNVHVLRANPCKLWIRSFGATTGNAFVFLST
jgi:hypothetical protein